MDKFNPDHIYPITFETPIASAILHAMIHPVFADVNGHAKILEMLSRLIPHPGNAYLFTGPMGVGKRMIAERFATGMLGVGANGIRPSLDAHPDFIRLAREEGARDITVKQARELMRRVSMSSARGGRMVVLIEEADALNEEAANALLKAVEEPRPHVTYIFLAERIDRLPATLRSRMAPLRFERTTLPNPPSIREGGASPVPLLVKEGLGEVLGKYLVAVESFSKYAESQELPERAWRQQLGREMEQCRAAFLQNPKDAVWMAEGLIHAWKLVGSSLSPRFALEWSRVRHFIPPTSLPSFLDIPYL